MIVIKANPLVSQMIKNLSVTLTIISFHFLGTHQAYSQRASNGFYIVIETKIGCTNLVPGLSRATTYCLPKGPVITSAEFETVSDIKFDAAKQLKSFNLKLSPEGFKILKILAGRLPDSRMALVIDNTVAGIFESKGMIVNQTVPIRGAIDSHEIDWIYDKIKKTKP